MNRLRNDKKSGVKKVLTTGVFDILHTGHLDYLEYAKSLGDFLVVHLDNDKAVRRHKGENRPINNENDRLRMINSLKIVDQAFLDDGERNYKEILEKYRPDVFVLASKDTFNKAEKEALYKKILPDLKVVWFDKKSTGNLLKSTSKILKKLTQNI